MHGSDGCRLLASGRLLFGYRLARGSNHTNQMLVNLNTNLTSGYIPTYVIFGGQKATIKMTLEQHAAVITFVPRLLRPRVSLETVLF